MQLQADILQYMQNAPILPPLFLPISAWGEHPLPAPLRSSLGPKLAKDLNAQCITLSFHLPRMEEGLISILGPDNHR